MEPQRLTPALNHFYKTETVGAFHSQGWNEIRRDCMGKAPFVRSHLVLKCTVSCTYSPIVCVSTRVAIA